MCVCVCVCVFACMLSAGKLRVKMLPCSSEPEGTKCLEKVYGSEGHTQNSVEQTKKKKMLKQGKKTCHLKIF